MESTKSQQNDKAIANFSSIEWLTTQAVAKHKEGKLEEAIAFYLEVIELNSKSPSWVYGNVIASMAKTGYSDEVLKLGEKALNLYPHSDEIYRSIGIAFEVIGELESSAKCYKKSLELNPNQPEWVSIKLADHLESISLKKHQLGDVQKAQELFNKSTQVKQQAVTPTIELNNLLKSPSADSTSTEKKLKGAVISWDMSHNPAGRAYLLADMAKMHFDVELIGPIFSFYGKEIWSPIQSQDMDMSVFHTSNFVNFVQGAIKLARAKKYDLVYVSKPRFPSLFIGMLIKHYSGCPLILDIDDHELSFFNNKPLAEFDELINSPRDENWYKLYSEIWTRFGESLIPTADALTVSNISLQQRFGGVIVRHARNEKIFDPQLYNRTAIRSHFGYQDSDRVILFLGTPRPHKGVFRIAQALDNLNDPNIVLCVIGTINDKRVANRFAEYKNARIDFHDNQPWERLPELVSMADLICILQDPKSPIADYQIPAKLTDAMAMGVPTMVTKVPPLQDLIASKSVIAVEQDNLETAIEDFFQNKNSKILQHSRKRYTYIGEFTYGVNSERIKQTIAIAKKNYQPFPQIYTEIFRLISKESGIEILDEELSNSIKSTSPTKTSVSIKKTEPFNVLFFWKQNDSDLYARRQDMITKYLANSDRINKVIHFDAPISAGKLQELVQHGPKAKFSQNNLVFTNTVDRFLGLKDTKKIIKRTFVYRDKSSGEKFLGKVLPQKSDYPNFVRQVIKEAGIGRNTLAWVCPVNFEFPELHQELKFGCVIADIIDDQRQWDVKPQYLVRLSENYQQILESANMVFTNCEPVKQSFQDLNPEIDVIPNGSELFTRTDNWEKPEFLAGLQGPIIGYVGNLSDRIDIELLKYIAGKNPDWNIVMIGSAHGSAQIFELVKYANIHLLGVKPYDEAVKFIKHFDVAMIPHINNKLTKNMNCLKLYVYFAVGIPIVSTEIANIDEFAGSIYVATNREDFNQGIKKILAGEEVNHDSQKRKQLLEKIDWTNRVDKMLCKVDQFFVHNSISKNSNQFLLSEPLNSKLDVVKSTKNKGTSLKTDNSKSSKQNSTSHNDSDYKGICSLCGTEQLFSKQHRSLREGYKCKSCRCSLRYREQASTIVSIFGNDQVNTLEALSKQSTFKELAIYEPQINSPFVKYFSKFKKYARSWYWEDVPIGSFKDGIKCQKLSKLSYSNDLFDLVISSDIMDLCREPLQAFKEIWRVMKPGGYYIFTIPALKPMSEKTVFRVDTSDKKDSFLQPPIYRKEFLVYTVFGNDFLDQVANIGFEVKTFSPLIDDHEVGKQMTFVVKKKSSDPY